MYRMLIRGSALLGLEPGRVAPRKTFPSTPGGADTPARIAGDGDKNGGEVNSTRRHPGMNVDPSDRDNHSGPGGGYSLIDYEVVEPVALSLAGGEAHPPIYCLLLLRKHCYWRPPLLSGSGLNHTRLAPRWERRGLSSPNSMSSMI
uniref:Uncharacterized protein n=1 Tax=Picea glauca TaxID=3330 RepID=A0A101M3S2_PICGL|nr:hypothetical protein ABT39_MTgene379 [Picea glauca]QHR86486.1 putative maturase [Picea sitchensis]